MIDLCCISLNWPGSGESDDEDDNHDQEKDHDALRDGSAHHDVVAAHPHRAPCGLHILLPHDLDKHQKFELGLQWNLFLTTSFTLLTLQLKRKVTISQSSKQ